VKEQSTYAQKYILTNIRANISDEYTLHTYTIWQKTHYRIELINKTVM